MREITESPLILESGQHTRSRFRFDGDERPEPYREDAGYGCIMELVDWLDGNDKPTSRPACVGHNLAVFMWAINDRALEKFGRAGRDGDQFYWYNQRYLAADAHQTAELTRLGLKCMGRDFLQSHDDRADEMVQRAESFDQAIRWAEDFIDRFSIPHTPKKVVEEVHQ